MTLIILAAVFAVLGFALIVIPFHVAMTGICFLGLSAVCVILRLLRGKKHERTWRVILLTLTGACMLTVFGAMAYIDRSGRSNTFEAGSAPEFVVVLGAQVQGDQPSLTLKKRLDLALSYLNDHPQAKVIVSGAQGADEAYTEAYVMAKYLIEQGVDESRVIQEEQAHDTRENLEYSACSPNSTAWIQRLFSSSRVISISAGQSIWRGSLAWSLTGLPARRGRKF